MNTRSDISVMIPVSVLPSHPNTHILDWVIGSVRSHLFDAPIYLMFDGVRDEQIDRKPDYEEFKRRLRTPQWCGPIHKVEFDTFHHQAAMLRETLKRVTTPLMFFLESDWILTGNIPWDAMATTILERKADVIRLHQEQTLSAAHECMFLDTVEINGLLLRKQMCYWSQPNLGYTDWWRDQLAKRFTADCRIMVEDRMYGVCQHPDTWGTPDKVFMYTPAGGFKRVSHQDGRGKADDGTPLVSKFEDRFIP